MENAIVHSVEVSKAKVLLVISGHIEGADVVLKVKDNGVGIPKEILEHLLTRNGNDGKEVDVRRAHTDLVFMRCIRGCSICMENHMGLW